MMMRSKSALLACLLACLAAAVLGQSEEARLPRGSRAHLQMHSNQLQGAVYDCPDTLRMKGCDPHGCALHARGRATYYVCGQCMDDRAYVLVNEGTRKATCECAAGYAGRGQDGMCKKCPAGTDISPGGSISKSVCLKCPRGSFVNEDGSDCLCPAGYYRTLADQPLGYKRMACNPCQARGAYISDDGHTKEACSLCRMPLVANKEHTDCVPADDPNAAGVGDGLLSSVSRRTGDGPLGTLAQAFEEGRLKAQEDRLMRAALEGRSKGASAPTSPLKALADRLRAPRHEDKSKAELKAKKHEEEEEEEEVEVEEEQEEERPRSSRHQDKTTKSEVKAEKDADLKEAYEGHQHSKNQEDKARAQAKAEKQEDNDEEEEAELEEETEEPEEAKPKKESKPAQAPVNKAVDSRDDKTSKHAESRDDKTSKHADSREDKTSKHADSHDDKTSKHADSREDKPSKHADSHGDKSSKHADSPEDKPSKHTDSRDDKPSKHADSLEDKKEHQQKKERIDSARKEQVEQAHEKKPSKAIKSGKEEPYKLDPNLAAKLIPAMPADPEDMQLPSPSPAPSGPLSFKDLAKKVGSAFGGGGGPMRPGGPGNVLGLIDPEALADAGLPPVSNVGALMGALVKQQFGDLDLTEWKGGVRGAQEP